METNTTVTGVNVSTNVNFSKQINGTDTRFMYTFQGDTPPTSINVSSNAQGGGGVNLNLNLYINPDGTNSPSGEFGAAPYNAAYYAALKTFSLLVFKNYKNPTAL